MALSHAKSANFFGCLFLSGTSRLDCDLLGDSFIHCMTLYIITVKTCFTCHFPPAIQQQIKILSQSQSIYQSLTPFTFTQHIFDVLQLRLKIGIYSCKIKFT